MGNGNGNEIGNLEKTEDIRRNQPLNSSNSIFGNTSHMEEQDLNNNMDNVTILNHQMEAGEQNDNINRNSHSSVMRDSLTDQKLGIEGELNAPQGDKLTEEEKKEALKKQLDDLDREISVLGNADNMKFSLPKEESEQSTNFVARYKNRNSLVKMMTRRIRFVKQKLNKGISGADIEKIENMVKETEQTNQQIGEEDSELAAWKSYTNNKKEIDDTMDAILKDTHLNDSKYYDDIVDSIKKYRKNPTKENKKELQNYLKIYINKRTRRGKKKDEDFREKGRIRIQRMRLLADRLRNIDELKMNKEKNEVKAESKINYTGAATKNALTARQRRYEEFLEINKQFKVLKDASTILITQRMLTPEYVKKNMKEMKGYVETIKKAQSFLDDWYAKYHGNYPDNEQGVLMERLYTTYSDGVSDLFKTNVGLEDFVNACEVGDKDEIEKKRKSITNKIIINDKKVEDAYKEGKKDMYNRRVGAIHVRYIVGAFDKEIAKEKLDGDDSRLGGVLEGYLMNDDGKFESDKDREIFKKNLDFVDKLYYGSLDDYMQKVEKIFEEQSKYVVTKKMMTKDYIISHYTKIAFNEARNMFKQNILNVREGVRDALDKKIGGNYEKVLSKNDITKTTEYLTALTEVLGFGFNTMKLITEDFIDDMENDKERMREGFEELVDQIETRDKNIKKEKQKKKRK